MLKLLFVYHKNSFSRIQDKKFTNGEQTFKITLHMIILETFNYFIIILNILLRQSFSSNFDGYMNGIFFSRDITEEQNNTNER